MGAKGRLFNGYGREVICRTPFGTPQVLPRRMSPQDALTVRELLRSASNVYCG